MFLIVGFFMRIITFLWPAPYSPDFPHLRSYGEYAMTHPEKCLCVRYEDMKQNPK